MGKFTVNISEAIPDGDGLNYSAVVVRVAEMSSPSTYTYYLLEALVSSFQEPL